MCLSCPKIANVLNPPHIMFFLHGIKAQSRARLPIRVANQNTVGGRFILPTGATSGEITCFKGDSRKDWSAVIIYLVLYWVIWKRNPQGKLEMHWGKLCCNSNLCSSSKPPWQLFFGKLCLLNYKCSANKFHSQLKCPGQKQRAKLLVLRGQVSRETVVLRRWERTAR